MIVYSPVLRLSSLLGLNHIHISSTAISRSVGLVLLTIFSALFIFPELSYAQLIKTYKTGVFNTQGGIPSNAISAIHFEGTRIWFGTGRGLSVTPDSGLSFVSFENHGDLGKGGISAIANNGDTVWIATVFDSVIIGEREQVGGGLSWSTDGGNSWNYVPQPVDPRVPVDENNFSDSLGYFPTTTTVSNLTFDIAFHDNAIWIASFAGGLRKSSDRGITWDVVTPDGQPFNALGNLKHRVFSVISVDNALWVGTAGGISKSLDGGETWTNYSAQNSGISGNFITQLAWQRRDGRTLVWAATRVAEDTNEFNGVSMTSNNGLTWETMLEGEKVHNFSMTGFMGLVVSDNGLFRTANGGRDWDKFIPIFDTTGERILTTEYFDVAYRDGLILVGTADGLANTTTGGLIWNIFRTFPTPGSNNEPEVYAYPNPFSPTRHNIVNGAGHVRFQYRTSTNTEVTLTIYDYGMNLVRTVVSNKPRVENRDYSETWDGINEWGVMVANGVYFYKLEKKGEGVLWGKLIVMN